MGAFAFIGWIRCVSETSYYVFSTDYWRLLNRDCFGRPHTVAFGPSGFVFTHAPRSLSFCYFLRVSVFIQSMGYHTSDIWPHDPVKSSRTVPDNCKRPSIRKDTSALYNRIHFSKINNGNPLVHVQRKTLFPPLKSPPASPTKPSSSPVPTPGSDIRPH